MRLIHYWDPQNIHRVRSKVLVEHLDEITPNDIPSHLSIKYIEDREDYLAIKERGLPIDPIVAAFYDKEEVERQKALSIKAKEFVNWVAIALNTDDPSIIAMAVYYSRSYILPIDIAKKLYTISPEFIVYSASFGNLIGLWDDIDLDTAEKVIRISAGKNVTTEDMTYWGYPNYNIIVPQKIIMELYRQDRRRIWLAKLTSFPKTLKDSIKPK